MLVYKHCTCRMMPDHFPVLVFMLPQAPSLSNVISYHDYDGHLISWLMIIELFDEIHEISEKTCI